MTEDLIEASEKDVLALKKLWQECGLVRPWNEPERDIEYCLAQTHSTIFVKQVDGVIAGSVMCGHDGHRGWIYYLAVSPDQQGHGLGNGLMTKAESWLADLGIWKVNLMIRSENARVEAFYSDLGYLTEDRIIMGKQLG